MPKESFYDPSVPEDEIVEFAHSRAFNVCWGNEGTDPDGAPIGAVYVAGGVQLDASGVDRLIRVLRKAKRQAFA